MLPDLRYALRTLTTSPGFSALVVIVLAVGIGATTAIFSVVDGVLLEPLPFAHADRLMAVDTTVRSEPDDTSYPDFEDWHAQTQLFERLAVYSTDAVTLTGVGPAQSIPAAVVTPEFFPALGTVPVVGRVFTVDDNKPGAERTVILSESLWTSRFDRDPACLGRSITLDAEPFTIVGVLPTRFQFPYDAEDPPQLWVPVFASRFATQWATQRNASFLKSIGLLRPGVLPEQAQRELSAIEAQAMARSGRSGQRAVLVRPLQQALVKDYRVGLLVLLGAVGSVLLIACANVANLLLARGSVRRREIAVRAALGASRAHIVRQLLAESLTLGTIGGIVGAVLSLWTIDVLVRMSPVQIPRLHAVHLDGVALLFTALVSGATGMLTGIVPALQLSGSSAGSALNETARGASSARATATRQLLVIGEVAVSVVLLASGGLLVRSLMALEHVSPGFVTERALAMPLTLPPSRYPDAKSQTAFARTLHAELHRLPGVSSASIATTLPMSGNDIGLGYVIEGRPAEPGTRTAAAFFAISPDYFVTLGIPVVQGRGFTDRDDEHAPNVLVVSQTFARTHWPGGNAIGQRVTIGYNHTGPREIVGIVGDVKQGGLADRATPQMYAPFVQTPMPFISVVVRTNSAPESAMASIRGLLARVDPMQGIGEMKTLDEYVSQSIATPRFTATLVGAFALLALLLAALGLFSVMAYSVAQRRREIGVRMALGAQAGHVRSLVLRQALCLGAVGLAIGLAGGLGATRLLGTLLFGVTPYDPATFVAMSAALLLVLLAAAYLPARRATRVDPMMALRTD